MSNLRHNIIRNIIFIMLFVVIVAHPSPYSANNNYIYYGKNENPKKQNLQLQLQTIKYNTDNDPSDLFKQLDKDVWNVELNATKQKEDLSSWLNSHNNSRQREEQQRHMERIQNEAADCEFERLMKLNLQREQPVGKQGSPTLQRKKTYNKKSTVAQSLTYCCKEKSNGKFDQPKVTTIAPYMERGNTTTPAKNKTEEKPITAKRLQQISKRMKKRAVVIVKHLNRLEIELLSCGKKKKNKKKKKGGGKKGGAKKGGAKKGGAKKAKAKKAKTTKSTISTNPTTTICPNPTTTSTFRTEPTTTTRPTTTTTSKIMTTEKPPISNQNNGKTYERLDKPTTTTRKPNKYINGFYFGYRPPGERNTEADMAAALKEEQRLEQKVREEQQMQREAARAELQHEQQQQPQRQRYRLPFKAKRDRYARKSMQESRAKHVPKKYYEKHSKNTLRNHNYLAQKPNSVWKNVKRKRMQQMSDDDAKFEALRNRVLWQKQQQQYHFNRGRQ